MMSAELESSVADLEELIADIGNKFGRFTEGEFFPALARVLSERFDLAVIGSSHRRLDEQTGKILLELDGFGYSRGIHETAVIIEAKANFCEWNLQDLLEKLRLFPTLLPEHCDKKLYGIVAATTLTESLKNEALNYGLFVAQIDGKNFRLTDEPAEPTNWITI